MTKDHQSGTRGSAIVVGASLAGLMSALALSRIGLRVTMLERSTRKVRTGAALPVSDGLLERLTAGCSPDGKDILPSGGQAWADVHASTSAPPHRPTPVSPSGRRCE